MRGAYRFKAVLDEDRIERYTVTKDINCFAIVRVIKDGDLVYDTENISEVYKHLEVVKIERNAGEDVVIWIKNAGPKDEVIAPVINYYNKQGDIIDRGYTLGVNNEEILKYYIKKDETVGLIFTLPNNSTHTYDRLVVKTYIYNANVKGSESADVSTSLSDTYYEYNKYENGQSSTVTGSAASVADIPTEYKDAYRLYKDLTFTNNGNNTISSIEGMIYYYKGDVLVERRSLLVMMIYGGENKVEKIKMNFDDWDNEELKIRGKYTQPDSVRIDITKIGVLGE